MSSGLSRRDLLMVGGAAWLGAGAMGRVLARPQGPTKKVLFFIKSAGFPHSVVTKGKSGEPSLAEQILTKVGKEHGFEVVATKDGRMFEPDKIGEWDAFVFETTGNLLTEGTMEKSPAMSPDGEKAFYDAIRGGKGFLGMHCATDTFGQHRRKGADDPYIQMIGGEFNGHGRVQEEVEIDIVDPKFPGIAEGFGRAGESFRIKDEWYALRHIADDLHVILVQKTEGMTGPMYRRPNYPMTWARKHGKGRVFYTSMGHREDVWESPMYQGLLLGALGWATGRVEADVEPNVRKVTPHYDQLHA